MLERTILDRWPGLAETKTISAQTGAGTGAELGKKWMIDHYSSRLIFRENFTTIII